MPTHHSGELERAAARRRTGPEAGPLEGGADAHPLLALQRQLGNAQIARMLAQRESVPDEDENMIQARHDPAIAQRESTPDDEDELLQATPEVGLEGGPVSDTLAQRIESGRGGGAALDAGLRVDMEGALGADFEGVRVHADAESAHLNRSISAKAFTTGNDIFLGQDASAADRSRMAHELTHVVQQRSMASSGPMTVGPAGDSYEQQADAVAAAVTSAPATQRTPEE
jgi:hypothetical protein